MKTNKFVLDDFFLISLSQEIELSDENFDLGPNFGQYCDIESQQTVQNKDLITENITQKNQGLPTIKEANSEMFEVDSNQDGWETDNSASPIPMLDANPNVSPVPELGDYDLIPMPDEDENSNNFIGISL